MTQRTFGIILMGTFAIWAGYSIYLLRVSQAMRDGVLMFFGLGR